MCASFMLAEAAETPDRVRDALTRDSDLYAELGARLRAAPPRYIATIARGSSDHAAAYGNWLIGLLTNTPCFSAPIASAARYGATPTMAGALALAVSQSGASADLRAALKAAKEGGALTVSLVNQPDSPLAALADVAIPQQAGAEQSVAATKSFILSCVALARLAAVWKDDAALLDALQALPDHLRKALACDWSAALPQMDGAHSLFIVARGPAFPIAREMALKLKELTYLHAEAASAAEIQHGPKAIIDGHFRLLGLDTGDQGGADTRQTLQALSTTGAATLLIGGNLPLPPPLHPLLDPLAAAVSFYLFVEALARRRGIDPDHPRSLRKVTLTN